MRLGVAGMMPNSLDEITPPTPGRTSRVGLTGVGMGLTGTKPGNVTEATVDRTRQRFANAGMDFAQLIVGFGGCLFDPDPAVRSEPVAQIGDGIQLSHRAGAHVTLIRTGSLHPTGNYAPARENHASECHERLVDTLRIVAETANAVGQTVVIMMLEHPPEKQYPLASRNTHQVLAKAGIPVY